MTINKVPGVGPTPCDIMILGEAPGVQENNMKIPFVGKTGQELNELYLPKIGRKRRTLHLDNVIQYHPLGNRTPGHKELDKAVPDLMERVDRVQPKFILALGGCANYALSLGTHNNIERIRSRAYKSSLVAHAIIIPCVHPAAGFRSGKMMKWCLEDFEYAGEVIAQVCNGTFVIPPNVSKSEYNIVHVSRKSELFGLLAGQKIISLDTEDVFGAPFSIQLAVRNSNLTGIFVSTRDHELIAEVFMYLNEAEDLICHHAIHDVAVLLQMGFDITRFKGRFHDTMITAKHRCNQPLGLKSLVYRHLNEYMDDYTQMVAPYQNTLSLEYLEKVSKVNYTDLPATTVWKKKHFGDKYFTECPYQPQNVGDRIRRMLYRYGGWPEEVIQKHVDEYRKKVIRKELGMRSVKRTQIDELWEKVSAMGVSGANSDDIESIREKYAGDDTINLWESWHAMGNKHQVIERFGQMPQASIADVPIETAVDYSVRDAINTLRLWEVL